MLSADLLEQFSYNKLSEHIITSLWCFISFKIIRRHQIFGYLFYSVFVSLWCYWQCIHRRQGLEERHPYIHMSISAPVTYQKYRITDELRIYACCY